MSRQEYLREAKRRQRARGRAAACQVITITLTADEARLFFAARDQQRGPVDDFARRCLTTGAMFLANSGTPRGHKLRGKTSGDDVSTGGVEL